MAPGRLTNLVLSGLLLANSILNVKPSFAHASQTPNIQKPLPIKACEEIPITIQRGNTSWGIWVENSRDCLGWQDFKEEIAPQLKSKNPSLLSIGEVVNVPTLNVYYEFGQESQLEKELGVDLVGDHTIKADPSTARYLGNFTREEVERVASFFYNLPGYIQIPRDELIIYKAHDVPDYYCGCPFGGVVHTIYEEHRKYLINEFGFEEDFLNSMQEKYVIMMPSSELVDDYPGCFINDPIESSPNYEIILAHGLTYYLLMRNLDEEARLVQELGKIEGEIDKKITEDYRAGKISSAVCPECYVSRHSFSLNFWLGLDVGDPGPDYKVARAMLAEIGAYVLLGKPQPDNPFAARKVELMEDFFKTYY